MFSPIEEKYLNMLSMAEFPEAIDKPVAEEPSLDGLQIAAGPTQTRTDAPQGYGEIRAVQPTKLESALQSAGVTLEQIGRFVDNLGQVNVPGLGEMSLADLLPFVGSAKPGTRSVMGPPDWQGTPMALQAPAEGKPLVTGKGQTLQLSPDAKLAAFDVLPAAQGVKTAAGLAKTGAKNLAPTAGKMAEDYLAKTGGLMKAAPDIKVFNEPITVQPSINTLSGGFDNSITNFLTLDPPARIERTKQANQVLAKWLGTNSAGKTKPLLTTNGKLLKTEKGVEGGEPITLPDGRNVESAGLALSPAFKEGKFTTCPNSASCAGDCLGKTSGGYFFMGGGADLNALKGPRMRSFELTQAFMRDPENFAIKLNDEITALKIKAAQNGNHLAIRLNVLSDINPRVYEKIIKGHPDVTFYDYTKNNTNPIAPNHHYTYSSTGVSQPAGYNGLKESIDNPNQNWKQMRRRLDSGSNVAMAFSHKSILPERVIDEETGKIYKVIDGDTYDFRPLDIQPPGTDGVIIGLRNKANTRKEVSAAKDSNGFFVHFDPQIQKAKGKQVRDESGKPVYGNRDVTIAKQGTGQITLTNDYQPLGDGK